MFVVGRIARHKAIIDDFARIGDDTRLGGSGSEVYSYCVFHNLFLPIS